MAKMLPNIKYATPQLPFRNLIYTILAKSIVTIAPSKFIAAITPKTIANIVIIIKNMKNPVCLRTQAKKFDNIFI